MKTNFSFFAVSGVIMVVIALIATAQIGFTAPPPVKINFCTTCGFSNFANALKTQLGTAADVTLNGDARVGTFEAEFPDGSRISMGQEFSSNGPALGGAANPADVKQFADAIRKKIGAAESEANRDECIIPRPGQANEGDTITGEGAELKPSGTVGGGYGKTADPTKTKIHEGIQDKAEGLLGGFNPLLAPFPNEESDLNFKLRVALKGDTLQEHVNAALAIKPAAPPEGKPPVKRTVRIPSAAEAQSFDGKTYKINGIDVAPGKYTVNKPGTDGLVFDENCEPKKGPIPSPENPLGEFGDGEDVGIDGGGGGGGGGGGDEGGGGGGGGLASVLPALMQMLGQLGQQKQQAQQQQAQNPLYNAQGQCSQQGVSPVCGVDGKTYTNECYLQQMGITLAKKGVCDAPAASPTPAVTPNAAAIASQLSESGIPASLLATIQASIISALTAAFGGNVGETVIR